MDEKYYEEDLREWFIDHLEKYGKNLNEPVSEAEDAKLNSYYETMEPAQIGDFDWFLTMPEELKDIFI